jgi:hypothetical protein
MYAIGTVVSAILVVVIAVRASSPGTGGGVPTGRSPQSLQAFRTCLSQHGATPPSGSGPPLGSIPPRGFGNNAGKPVNPAFLACRSLHSGGGSPVGRINSSGSLGGTFAARSGPAAGGVSGAVSAVSAGSFRLVTAAGQHATVNETTSTTYRDGTSSIRPNSIAIGTRVLVLGEVRGTTITATQVMVEPPGGGTVAASGSQVVPFQRGAPSAARAVGQIPPGWTQGSGTIISGPAANDATEAALAAYPGVIVDRVVKLSNGEYNVHCIGINWPHHVFVSDAFRVVGAE